MVRKRKRYLDNTTPADNTANVVRPVNRMIQVKQQDTPARREKETREYKAIQERAKYTPVNPRQASIGPYREKTALDKAGGRLYAEAEQRRKDAEDREAAGVVLNSLFKPILPSTYADMAAAIKNGQVNNFSDALAAPYLSDSWSMRNPGKALVADILTPIAAGDIARGYKAMRMGLRNPRLGIVADSTHPSGFRFTEDEIQKLSKNASTLANIRFNNMNTPLGDLLAKDYDAFVPSGPVYNESQKIAKYLTERHNIPARYQANKKFAKHFNRTYEDLEGYYPVDLTDSGWDVLMDDALNKGDIKKAFQLRLAHNKAALDAHLSEGSTPVRFPMVHTVNDRFNPNFNAFNTNIEGKPTFVYGTPIDEAGVNMSRSYASQKALRQEPQRTKRLLAWLSNPLEFDAKNTNWNKMPVPIITKQYLPNDLMNTIIGKLNTRVRGIQTYINEANPSYNLSLPRLNYGDDLAGYVSNIRARLRDADFNPHTVHEYHRHKFLEEHPTKNFRPPYRYPSFMPEEVIREEMLSHDILDSMSVGYSQLYDMGEKGLGLRHSIFDPDSKQYIIRGKERMSTRELENELRQHGEYDGFIIDNVFDYGGWNEPNYQPSTVYGIRIPSNIKSANPITYDDAGNMIPLSKRDNFYKNDLRYGLLPFTIGGLGLSLYNKK